MTRLKSRAKVIRDSNPDFQINPHLDVCRITPKMYWIHSLVCISHFAKFCKKSAADCMRNANKSKITYSATVRKWKSDPESISGSPA